MRLICVGKEFLSVGQNLTRVPLNYRRSGLEFQQPVAGIDKARKYNFISLNSLLGEMRKDEKISV
jgi:hypothetical protein